MPQRIKSFGDENQKRESSDITLANAHSLLTSGENSFIPFDDIVNFYHYMIDMLERLKSDIDTVMKLHDRRSETFKAAEQVLRSIDILDSRCRQLYEYIHKPDDCRVNLN